MFIYEMGFFVALKSRVPIPKTLSFAKLTFIKTVLVLPRFLTDVSANSTK